MQAEKKRKEVVIMDVSAKAGGSTMDVPVKAEVHCSDGPAGHATQVIIDPASEQVTHIVVAERGFAGVQRLVPVSFIKQSTSHLILLSCTRQELSEMRSFLEPEFIRGSEAWMQYQLDEYMMWPMVTPIQTPMVINRKMIPLNELALTRGARVEATDGRVGKVDEFIVEPGTGHITHLVMREGHLWEQREITISVAEIERMGEGVVYLKLSAQQVGALPSIPVQRRWL